MRLDRTPLLSRRAFIAGVGITGTGIALVACSGGDGDSSSTGGSDRIEFGDSEIDDVESERPSSGNVVKVAIAASVASFSVGGQNVEAKSYLGEGDSSSEGGSGSVPIGPEIRASVGDLLQVTHDNELDEDTIIHWHGLHLRNDMDGAPPLTGPQVLPGTGMDYEFLLDHPGTYWYHSHSGLQADEAMLGALIVEDPDDPYHEVDEEHVIILDDWITGFGASPDEILQALNPALGGHAGHGGHGTATPAPTTGASEPTLAALDRTAGPYPESEELGGMTQHIAYPTHLMNGYTTDDARPIAAGTGSTVRLRIINAAAETPYRFAIGGHTMTVIETDGFACEPTKAESVIVGMAQRVDVLVELDDSGSWPIVAQVEGTDEFVATELRAGDGDNIDLSSAGSIAELASTPLQDNNGLVAAERTMLEDKEPDRTFQLELIQSEEDYVWGIGGPDVGNIDMKMGERIRVKMVNDTDMWHPMHLHGHTFSLPDFGGLRRDTVIIHPNETVVFEFDADNPGGWMFHCHNAYHLDAGMTTNFYYER